MLIYVTLCSYYELNDYMSQVIFMNYIIISEYQLCKVHTTHIFRDETAGVTALSK